MMAMMATINDEEAAELREVTEEFMESRCDCSELGMCILFGLLLWLLSGWDVSTANGFMSGVGKTFGHQARNGISPNPPF